MSDEFADPPPDDLPPIRPSRLIGVTIAFEFGLAVLAVGIGWLVGYRPLAWLHIRWDWATARDLAVGVTACGPMVLGLLVIDRCAIGPLRDLKGLVEERLVPLFSRARIWHLLLISAAAGLGEELLFRGLLQSGLADWIGGNRGQVVGGVVASLVFGACHWLSNTYAVLATLMGFYFAVLFIATSNLLAPIVAHGLYDFVALVYLLRWKPAGSSGNSAD